VTALMESLAVCHPIVTGAKLVWPCTAARVTFMLYILGADPNSLAHQGDRVDEDAVAEHVVDVVLTDSTKRRQAVARLSLLVALG